MKWLELLKETIPALTSAVVLWDPATGPVQLHAVEAAGRLLNVNLETVEIRAIAELERGFEAAGERRPDAIVVLTSPIFGTNPTLLRNSPSPLIYRALHHSLKLPAPEA
jgi:putative ABC transport system substrate-binding protein